MSYRNPGDIKVADPSAFMNSFEQGVSKWAKYYESKAEERRKKDQASDIALAEFQKSMKYSDLVKNYGAEAANTIKSYIEDKYVKSGVFKNATSSQRQEIYDDININLIGRMQKAEKGLALDNTDIDISMFDDSPEFQDFLLNKNRSGAAFTIKDGSIGYKYIDADNKERFIDANSIPDKLDSVKTKTQIYEGIGKQIDEHIQDIDYSYGTSDDVKPAYQKISEQTTSLFAKMDAQDKRAYYEKAMRDSGQQEPKYTYGDFPDDMPDDEKAKLLELQDKYIMASLKKRIEDGSKVINSDKNKSIAPNKPTAEQIKQAQSQDLAKERSTYFKEVKFKTKKQPYDYRGPDDNMPLYKSDPLSVVDFTDPTLPNVLSKKGVKMGNPYKMAGVIYVDLTDQVTNNTITVSEKDMTPSNFNETLESLVSGFENTGGLP